MNRSKHKGSERASRVRSVSPTRNSKLDGKDRLTRINRPNGRPRSAERDLSSRNETLSTRSAHVPRTRSTERARDRVLMSKSAHQPRGGMDEEGPGQRWKEAKDARDAARMRGRRPR